MKNPKRILAIATGLAAALSLTACGGASGLDVVGQDSVRAFEAVLTVLPAENRNLNWTITAPDGQAEFSWNDRDFAMYADLEPFVNAGFDISKNADCVEKYPNYSYDDYARERKITFILNRNDVGAPAANATDDFRNAVVRECRDSLNYHAPLDHYGVKLGGGNMFEWAKDMTTNGYDGGDQDKDIVFALNPEPLIAAGVDPEKVDGWVYAQVQVEENGKKQDVWKFLKPFNLK